MLMGVADRVTHLQEKSEPLVDRKAPLVGVLVGWPWKGTNDDWIIQPCAQLIAVALGQLPFQLRLSVSQSI